MKHALTVGAFVMAACVATLLLGRPSSAAGNPPPGSPAPVQFFTASFHLGGSTAACGFPVDFVIDGTAKGRGFEEGHTQNVVNYRFEWVVTGNGRTALLHEAYTETFFPNSAFPDLPIVRSQHGLTWQIRPAGGGAVTLDAGLLIYLVGGEIVVVHGPHPTELVGGLPAAIATICQALV